MASNTAGRPYWNGQERFTYKLKATGGGSNQYRARSEDTPSGAMLFAKGERSSGMGGAKSTDGYHIGLRNRRQDDPNLSPGSFTTFQVAFARRNQQMAEQLAELAAETLDKQVRTGTRARGKRSSASTKRLYNVIRDPRNRFSDKISFGVGSPRFMDHSEAKYWRAIEQGTTHFVGQPIYGIWGDTLTGTMGGGGAFGQYPIAGVPFSKFGAGDNGRLRPMGRKRAYALLRRSYGMNSARAKATIGLGWGRIKYPIQEHRYFREAWETYNVPRKAKEALRDSLAEIGIRITI